MRELIKIERFSLELPAKLLSRDPGRRIGPPDLCFSNISTAHSSFPFSKFFPKETQVKTDLFIPPHNLNGCSKGNLEVKGTVQVSSAEGMAVSWAMESII